MEEIKRKAEEDAILAEEKRKSLLSHSQVYHFYTLDVYSVINFVHEQFELPIIMIINNLQSYSNLIVNARNI